MTPGQVAGLLLAAGEGSRLGGPKALLVDPAGDTFLVRSLRALEAGGCEPLYVVVGARADDVAALAPPGTSVVTADDWREGMGASLRAGLAAVESAAAHVAAAVVMLVDTPGVTAEAVRRLVTRAPETLPVALARSAYDGVPGHPVLIGRSHWAGVRASARGDQGARDYLRAHPGDLVECGDVASGEDVDTVEALLRWRRRAEGLQRHGAGVEEGGQGG
ncbi:MAG: nucleotidyltransferase family protein [Nocardioidaceae bacterium]